MTRDSLTKTQEDLLAAAKNLFWKHGIRRVSVQEICKEASISKMTFYRNFENKEDIAFHVIHRMQTEGHYKYRTIMDSTIDFPSKVAGIVKMKKEGVSGISAELIKDIFENQDQKLQDFIRDFQNKMQSEIVNDFTNAQKEGHIRKNIKMDFILYMMNDMNVKAMDSQLQKIYPNEEDLIMELTNFFFYGTSPQNEQK